MPRTYLDGEARQGAFTGWLCLTLASVLLLVTAGNLFQLVIAWIATSLFLHRLLLFYPQRIGAQRAARKKFVTARLGDAALLGRRVLAGRRLWDADIGDDPCRRAVGRGRRSRGRRGRPSGDRRGAQVGPVSRPMAG